MGSFGETIREKRLALKMSQQTLADQVGIARQTVTMLEYNKIHSPSSQMVINLAWVLEIETKELLSKLPDLVMPFEVGASAKLEILTKLEKMETELHEIIKAVRQL